MASSEDDDEFEVERILTDDRVDGEMFYLVKWKGYGDEHCTWEPAESFTSRDSVQAWERQKKAGLGLPDEFLAELQEKMDRQQGRHHINKAVVDDWSPENSEPELPAIRIAKRPKMSYHTDIHHKASKSTEAGAIARKRKGIAIPVKKLRTKMPHSTSTASTQALVTQSEPRSTHAPIPSSKKQGRSVAQAGQRFRNLSHMNNYRKKARNEPAPPKPPQNLRSISDFPLGGGGVIRPRPRLFDLSKSRDESPLFMPDEENSVVIDSSPSPVRSDSVSFPPAPADHQPRNLPPVASSLTADFEPAPHIPKAKTPYSSTIRTGPNGRSWYKGDLVCSFWMGPAIGECKLIHVPLDQRIVIMSFKDGFAVKLDFEPEPITAHELQSTYRNSFLQPDVIGLIEPFEDQQDQFNDFALFLETRDAAAVLHVPAQDLSLLLYSSDAKSWSHLGRRPARTGRARLHLAFLPQLIRWTAAQRAPGPVSNVQRSRPTSLSIQTSAPLADALSASLPQQRGNSLQVQTPKSPGLTHIVNRLDINSDDQEDRLSNKSVKSPNQDDSILTDYDSAVASPEAMTPTSPTKPFSVGIDRRHRPSIKPVNVLEQTPKSHKGHASYFVNSHKLSISRMINLIEGSPKIDPKKFIFFISFSKLFTKEARVIQKWLELRIPPTSIYLDSDRQGWAQFKDRVHNVPSIILFHRDDLHIQKMAGLGVALSRHNMPVCYAVAADYEKMTKLSPDCFRMKKVLPRAIMYLISESLIIHHLDEVAVVLQYFDKNKKPDYRIMMRPRIQQWLLKRASEEENMSRRNKLIDLVVVIRDLGRHSAAPLDSDEDEYDIKTFETVDGKISPNYILSSSSIPGYDDIETLAPSTPKSATPVRPSHQPALTSEQRDAILRSYFYAFSAMRAYQYRRFMVVTPTHLVEQLDHEVEKKVREDKLDCGHVQFTGIKKFVAKFCGPQSEVKTVKSPEQSNARS